MSSEHWEASLPSCATLCFRTAHSTISCDESDLSCWCASDIQGELTEGVTDCFVQDQDCDEGFLRRA